MVKSGKLIMKIRGKNKGVKVEYEREVRKERERKG